MSLAYAATTEGCTFLLDENGICRRVMLSRSRRADTTLGGRTRAQAARQCVGAQYVASIDVRVEGGLVPMPRVGAPMLFAYTGEDGRYAVVRTGPLLRFETIVPDDMRSPDSAPTTEVSVPIPVDWDEDDDAMTIPLAQSGERKTPRVSLFDHDPWRPPPRPTAPSWSRMPSKPPVRLQRVARAGKGVLPRRAGRA